MFAKQTILAATALAALTMTGVGAASAAPFRPVAVHRPYVAREHVLETLRQHHYVGLGDTYVFHGRYVGRSHDRFGHLVLVELDPFTGRFIGEVRI